MLLRDLRRNLESSLASECSETKDVTMTIDQLMNLLAGITLVEMMLTIGLGVMLSDVLGVSKNWSLIGRALVANYVFIPGAAVGLLLLFHARPLVAAGILLAAVCPGAPYGPPFTGIAKGNVTNAVGLMVILAGSSALVAPLLLGVLLPIVVGGAAVNINVLKIVGTLFGAQLLPLCVGLWIRKRHPSFAERALKPAKTASLLLNLLLLAVIILAQIHMLSDIHLQGYMGMLCLLLACMAAGRVLTVRGENPKDLTITSSVRNVGVSLVIATASFAGTDAITSATAYALFQTFVVALVALAWGRFTPAVALVNKQSA
jgi:BASS family bile acid:Na+ symporter